MESSRDIKVKNYTYSLPENKIAKYPLDKRDESKLLIYRNGQIRDDKFLNIPDSIDSDNVLIFNNTEVIRSRLMFKKSTGATIEIFCLEPHNPQGYEQSLSSGTPVEWKCIVGNLKKWKSDDLEMTLIINGKDIRVWAHKSARILNEVIVRFAWKDDSISFSEILEANGHMPVPPYLNRDDEPIDNIRYQTVYSENKGSVAAPTAGLHFSEKVLDKIKSKGITRGNITLHVSAGTFIPVKSETIGEHTMHREHFFVGRDTIEMLKQGRVIAVGTTSVRTIETLFHLGNKLLNGYSPAGPDLSLEQWEAYDHSIKENSSIRSLDALLEHMNRFESDILHASTSIIIVPGYSFRIVEGLITNFHMPASTLLLLVSALIGKDWEEVYNHALTNAYRFLSYGDSSLLLP